MHFFLYFSLWCWFRLKYLFNRAIYDLYFFVVSVTVRSEMCASDQYTYLNYRENILGRSLMFIFIGTYLTYQTIVIIAYWIFVISQCFWGVFCSSNRMQQSTQLTDKTGDCTYTQSKMALNIKVINAIEFNAPCTDLIERCAKCEIGSHAHCKHMGYIYNPQHK